jgi:hypothetical protein
MRNPNFTLSRAENITVNEGVNKRCLVPLELRRRGAVGAWLGSARVQQLLDEVHQPRRSELWRLRVVAPLLEADAAQTPARTEECGVRHLAICRGFRLRKERGSDPHASNWSSGASQHGPTARQDLRGRLITVRGGLRAVGGVPPRMLFSATMRHIHACRWPCACHPSVEAQVEVWHQLSGCLYVLAHRCVGTVDAPEQVGC